MAANSPVPSQLRGALTDSMQPRFASHDMPSYYDQVSLRPLMHGGFADWQRLQEIFPDGNSVWNEDGPDYRFGVPVRLEAFWGLGLNERGIVIFDDQDQLIVHVVTALFGDTGRGSDLSQQILEHFGVPASIYEEIQAHTWGARPYKVVIARDGVEFGWQWWRIR